MDLAVHLNAPTPSANIRHPTRTFTGTGSNGLVFPHKRSQLRKGNQRPSAALPLHLNSTPTPFAFVFIAFDPPTLLEMPK